jgi:hypothetical protein
MRPGPYYAYSRHSSLEKAQDALEDYFASGIVCESEQPYIDGPHREQITRNYVTSWRYRYDVMFPMS